MSDYTTREVELMLHRVWDEQAVAEGTKFGGVRLPDPSMPKPQVDPSTSGNLLASSIDIKAAWESAPLTEKERRAMLMRFGLDIKQADIAEREGCAVSTMSTRLKTAVKKIAAQINGMN